MKEPEYIAVTQLTALNLALEALLEAGPSTSGDLFLPGEYQQVIKTVEGWMAKGYLRISKMMEEG